MNNRVKSGQFYAVTPGLAILLLAALACGPLSNLPGAAQEPTPTLFVLPDAATDTGGKSGGLTFSDAASSGLTSYRAKFTLTYDGVDSSGAPVSGSFVMDQAGTVDPKASFVKWDGQGAALQNGAGNFELTQIGDATYMVTSVDGAQKCLSLSGSGSGLGGNTTTPDSFFAGSDMRNARRIVPDETVNGVLSQHYQFTKDEVSLIGGNWTNYTVDVWNAVDGGYSVKSTFAGDGSDISFKGGQGHVEWTYDLLERNTPVDIQQPANCDSPAGADFPKMPDASTVVSFGSTITYSTASPTADVVAFYNAQLPALGWTPGASSATAPGFATLEFTKDSQKASITITESDGKTTVLITVQ